MTEHVGSELLPLYARFYFDEDVSASIVRNLRQRGFDAVCARDVQSLRLDDAAQLAFAVADRRALVTHNRCDFESLHEHYLKEHHTHYGIIIAKRRANDTAVVARLLALLDSTTGDELIDQLRYV